MTSQAIGKPVNTPTMSIETISAAIAAAIEAIVEYRVDIKTVEGQIS
jgi:pyrrolidone-carboxylate peptidase